MKSGNKPKVLIADDEPIIADTLQLILAQNGFEATAVYDGRRAVYQHSGGVRTSSSPMFSCPPSMALRLRFSSSECCQGVTSSFCRAMRTALTCGTRRMCRATTSPSCKSRFPLRRSSPVCGKPFFRAPARHPKTFLRFRASMQLPSDQACLPLLRCNGSGAESSCDPLLAHRIHWFIPP